MKRDLGRLCTTYFDLLIIGGGIYGACAAREAALRGLSVALVDRGDFGHATSSNSAKIVHGGFRYLQHLDLKRMRESIRERRHLLRIAPHLVHVMPFVLPTYREGLERRPVMAAALRLYDTIAWDRNHGQRDPAKMIPPGQIISREACLRLAPGVRREGLTGGAVWYDGQLYNPQRLVLAFLRSTEAWGACVANYVEVTDLLENGSRVTGVRIRDRLTGRSGTVRGRLVLNTTGPWVNRLVTGMHGGKGRSLVSFSQVIDLLVNRQFTDGYHGLSVRAPASRRSGDPDAARRIFIKPWRGRTLIGSVHRASPTDGDVGLATTGDLGQLVAHVNAAYPGASLRLEDVVAVHTGLLPRPARSPADPGSLQHHYAIVDHRRRDGIEGLLSVIGVKYTTARDVADKVVTVALRKLGRRQAPSRGAAIPVWGGELASLDAFLSERLEADGAAFGEDVVRQLVYNYGNELKRVMRYCNEQPALGRRLARDSTVIGAEVIHGIREEMAQHLGDVVFRRTELGTAGYPGQEALSTAAVLMAGELGWDAARTAQELEATRDDFRRAGCRIEGPVEVATP